MASIWKKFQEKYVISVRHQESFFETSKSTLSLLELLSIGFLVLLIPFLLSFFLFKYTSLGTALNPIKEEKEKIIALNRITDSLENEVQLQENYFENIQRILAGEELLESESSEIDSQEIAKISISDPGYAELNLRETVNKRELTSSTITSIEPTISYFNAPLAGVISSEYEPREEHYGIDIVSPKNTVIKAIADGTVLYSAWNVDDGYTIIMSHNDGFISIYKHSEELLKVTNEVVDSGEAIAIVGDSGENSSGYHLHFELWKDGIPVNPTNYINFES